MLRLIATISWVLLVAGCITPQNEGVRCATPGVNTPCRPFRAGVMKFNRELDSIKPLAPIDSSGWVLASDVLIGTISDQWLAGVSFKDRKVLWWVPTPTTLTTPVNVFGSWIMVGTRDGKVQKIEALTGKKVWEAQLGRFAARPFVLGGSTLIAVTASQQVYALDFQTGNVLWMYDAGEPDNLTIRSSAAALVRDRRVFLGTDKGEIHVVSLDNGKLEWRYNPVYTEDRFHDVVGEMFTVNNQIVVTRYDGVLAALTLGGSDRATLWKDTVPAVTTSTVRNGVLFAGCLNGDVYAVEAASGRRLWRATTNQAVGTLSAGEKVLYTGGTNGRVTAVDIVDGTVLWQDDIEGAVDAPPVVFGDRIYFATGLKALYGFRLM